MKKKIWLDLFFLIYFLVGAFTAILIKNNVYSSIINVLETIYMYSFFWITWGYAIYGCLFVKHRHFIMSIIDGILCYVLTIFFPYPVFMELYDNYKVLYYILSGIFVFLPVVYSFIDKVDLDIKTLINVIIRILMIIFIIAIILILQSCSHGLDSIM